MSEENKKAELPAHRDKRFDGVRDTWYLIITCIEMVNK